MRRLGAEPPFGCNRFAQFVGLARKPIVESRLAHAQGLFCRLAASHFGLKLTAELPRVVRDASLRFPVVVDLYKPPRELALRS